MHGARAYLCILHGGVYARLKIAKIAEDALFKFFIVADRAAEGFETKNKRADDVRAGDMVQAVPEDA